MMRITNVKKTRLILAGDVGGTKTRLGVFHAAGQTPRLIRMRDFQSSRYPGLETIVGIFINTKESISAACFGVAGPVVSGTAKATNLPWKVSVTSLKNVLSIERVSLINDLVANANGITVLSPGDFSVLNRGRRIDGNKALLSAGTGLGAAIMFWDGKQYIPSPSEGGHVEFGPRNRLDLNLLQHLFERFGHVSYERVLSGAGLFNIYQFLRDRGKDGVEPVWLRARFEKEDPAAVIANNARLKKSRLCSAALDLFASIYGSAAGNLALQAMATGGVYIGGGIAPKIIWKLRDGTFIKAFQDKGRLSSIVGRIPVKVVMNDRAALLGAAVRAMTTLQ
jgi:glucokinase